MRSSMDKIFHVLHVVEWDTCQKSVPASTTKDENYSVAIVKAPPTKENPVAINEGAL